MTLAHYGVVRIRPYMDQLTLPASNVFCFNVCSTGSAVFFRSVG